MGFCVAIHPWPDSLRPLADFRFTSVGAQHVALCSLSGVADLTLPEHQTMLWPRHYRFFPVFQEQVFEKGNMRNLGTTVSSTRGVSYHDTMGCRRHGCASARRMWEGFGLAGFAQLTTDALCICGFQMLPWASVGIDPFLPHRQTNWSRTLGC